MAEIIERVFDVRVITDGGSAGRVEFQLADGRVASINASIEKAAGDFAHEEFKFRGPRGNVDKDSGSVDPDPVGSTSDGETVTHPEADSPNVEAGSGDAETSGTMVADGVEGETADDESVSEEPAPQLKGKLPEDFPGHAALDTAGIHTYGQLRKALEGGVKIHGIGSATQAKIDEALAAAPADE